MRRVALCFYVIIGLLNVSGCDSRRVEQVPSENLVAKGKFAAKTAFSEKMDLRLNEVEKSAEKIRDLYTKLLHLLERDNVYTPIDLLLEVVEQSKRGFVVDTMVRRQTILLDFLPDSNPCRRLDAVVTAEAQNASDAFDSITLSTEKCRSKGKFEKLLTATWTGAPDTANFTGGVDKELKITLNVALLESYFGLLQADVEKATGCVIERNKLLVSSVQCTGLSFPVSETESILVDELNINGEGELETEVKGSILDQDKSPKGTFTLLRKRNGEVNFEKLIRTAKN